MTPRHAVPALWRMKCVCSGGDTLGCLQLEGSIIGLFCKRDLYKRRYSAKETCNLIDPTDRSHPIPAQCLPPHVLHSRHDSSIQDTTHPLKMWLIHSKHDSFIEDMTHSFKTWRSHSRNDSFMTHVNFYLLMIYQRTTVGIYHSVI